MEEQQLFNLLKSSLILDLEKTEQFNPADATSKELNLSIELKCRNKHYSNLLIERKKYNKLILNEKARYICSTPVGIYSFNPKKLPEPIWQLRWMPDTYYFDKPKYIQKEVGYYNINQGKNIINYLIK